MREILLTFFLITLYACQSPLEYEVYDYGDEIELLLGEKVTIGRDKLSIKFVDVPEDSRCPSNVTCVWAGNGKVRLQFDNDEVELNTYLQPHEVTLGNVNIQLLSLDPYPEHSRQFEKDDYKVRLLIIKT